MRQTSKPKRRVGFRYKRKRRRFLRRLNNIARNCVREFGEDMATLLPPWADFKPDDVFVLVEIED